ncbi:Uncharacterised protein [Vibrio cholerae]|nr:Uncharacterised protein [Vibrio cholerae]CSD26324.1 Uncharacterised protein [Vibrio cholerae]CSI14740.1 Uncharacterised protein [Vibrio cholerae]
MPLLVPNTPEKKPAIPIRVGFGSMRSGSKLTATANSTNKPSHSASACVEIHISSKPPTIDPGMRPIKAIFKPPIEILSRCFIALSTEINSATKQIGDGT